MCIKRAPTVNDWISVKERLPEQPDSNVWIWCLVMRKGAKLPTTEVNFDNGKWYYFGYMTGMLECEVTHWMPLPEPPKE